LDENDGKGRNLTLNFFVLTSQEYCFNSVITGSDSREEDVPAKKSNQLPTVKSKLVSLGNKKPKSIAQDSKKKLKNSLGKSSALPEFEMAFDWYGSAKKRFSVAQKREVANYFSVERFARIRDQ
jgi:hypothetical protein